jgi:hypothetical protein
MDRVRTGLTGLGLVFVLTLGASAVLRPAPEPQPAKEAAEPLAQLGVAPGAEKPRAEPAAPRTYVTPRPQDADDRAARTPIGGAALPITSSSGAPLV